MSLSIRTNVSAIQSLRQLRVADAETTRSIERLSSGLRVNRAADDAATLSISERMAAQVRGMAQASRNAQDGLSLMQTFDGVFAGMTDSMQRMRELAVQAANGTYTAAQRSSLNQEFSALRADVLNNIMTATFNGQPLVNTVIAPMVLQVGANKNETLSTPTAGATAIAAYTAFSTVALTSQAASQTAIRTVDQFQSVISGLRGDYGAVAERLEHVIDRLAVAGENMSAAFSRMRDTDVAEASMALTRSQILSQSATAMVVQGNFQSVQVLSLLGS